MGKKIQNRLNNNRLKKEERNANQLKLYEAAVAAYLYNKYMKEESIHQVNTMKRDLQTKKTDSNFHCLSHLTLTTYNLTYIQAPASSICIYS